jgi:DNA mismatch repair ATPase MutL
MINYNDAEVALNYLVGTDEEAARAKVMYEALYEQRKTIRAVQFLNAKGSAAERTEKALASDEYQEHLILIKDAQIDFEILRNKRFTNQSIIEMWRSVNSAMKMGNV